jgi:hypothetical protein
MNTTFLRTLFAIATAATLPAWAAANGFGFPNNASGWAGAQPGMQGGPIQQAGYYGGGLPAGQPMSYDGSCGDGGCYGGDCYGGDCYGGDCYGGGGDVGCCEDSGCCEMGGGYGGCGCGQCGCNPCCCQHQGCYDNSCHETKKSVCYAEVQNMFLRPHINEDAVGKLSEKYDWTPRFVVGFETPSGVGTRGRYFNYSQDVTILDNGGVDELGLDFQVIDVEGTGRIRTTHADVVLSGGFRWANIEITEDDDTIDSSMPGLTVAADGRTVFCRGCKSEWAGVAGARWSLLGGDWEGEENDLVDEARDDNVVVHELYGGVEWVCRTRSCDFYTRLVFEMQNWHSDVIGENSATDSIGFVGPAIHGGVTF